MSPITCRDPLQAPARDPAMPDPDPITIHDWAVALGLRPVHDSPAIYSAAGYWDLGFDFLGLCERCHVCIAPIEAHPARTGGWRCRRCIGCDGFDSVEEAEAWLSEEEALDRCDRGEAPFDAVDILV